MNADMYYIDDVVPHKGKMSLLDKVVAYTDVSLTAEVEIKESCLFYSDDGVPAYIGMEYMAQAIAAYGGVTARNKSEPVKVGFLVSSRKYDAPVSHFRLGTKLTVHVEEISYSDDGLSVFMCQIENKEFKIESRINVFMPKDVDQFLKGE